MCIKQANKNSRPLAPTVVEAICDIEVTSAGKHGCTRGALHIGCDGKLDTSVIYVVQDGCPY